MIPAGLRLSLYLLITAAASGQATPGSAAQGFDVASVRPSKAGSAQNSNVPLDAGNVYSPIDANDARTAAGGLLIATHQPLWRYLSFAYKLSGTQELALRFNFFSGFPKSGAPAWVTGGFDSPAEAFDIEARSSSNASIDQMRLMMQALLLERFHLAVHFETSEGPVFALVLVRPGTPGPDLRPHRVEEDCSPNHGPDPHSAATPESSAGQLPPICGVIAHTASSGNPGASYGGRGIPISLLATSLPTMTGMAVIPRPVVDQTRLPGIYDFSLHWAFSTADTENGDNTAAFREALKAQLGLQLKASRAPIVILVVDHIEHPSEN